MWQYKHDHACQNLTTNLFVTLCMCACSNGLTPIYKGDGMHLIAAY